MSPIAPLESYYAAHETDFLDGLKDFLRIPSISTLPEHRADIDHAAGFLTGELKRMGMRDVRLIEGEGHPLVAAEWLQAPGKPTLVIYGHYDVQPPDPLDEWHSPPFEPEVRGGDLFARGATDDKGQTYILLKAVEGFLQTAGSLPINIKFLIEGEEETGGEMIDAYLRQQGHGLRADAALLCDTEMFAPELPTLCVGLRGGIYTEVEVRGPRTDLHSGVYGGTAPNPLQAVAEIIAQLKDPDGKLLIPGIYDDLEPPTDAEREAWSRLPFDESEYLENEVGSTMLTGEPEYGVLERTWARPSLDVHGIRGGFIGEGAKTAIPARAVAKISIRLAPSMYPDDVFDKYRRYVEGLTPKGTVVSVRKLNAGPPSVVDAGHPLIRAAAEALTEVFGTPAVFIRSGGSIPVVNLFKQFAGIPTVMMGFGLPDDNLHAPNEKFHLPNFCRGIRAVARYLEKLGE